MKGCLRGMVQEILMLDFPKWGARIGLKAASAEIKFLLKN